MQFIETVIMYIPDFDTALPSYMSLLVGITVAAAHTSLFLYHLYMLRHIKAIHTMSNIYEHHKFCRNSSSPEAKFRIAPLECAVKICVSHSHTFKLFPSHVIFNQ